ncbi:uncharacterized protein SPSC_05196 [Sporisorium scitamineum]|uniref:SRR1-like domain-containing protein n=1 Tax=Sporisorium scitamineum TaxID=49012 RepID=A0A127ZHD1_9BASI|nr:uncharacterized protein SPSC_05196 [Sporisorium scitamineum]
MSNQPPPISHATAPTTRSDDDEQPFQVVRSKRRPAQRTPTNKSYSNSNGSITGPSSGFTYASTANGRGKSRPNSRNRKQEGAAMDEEEERWQVDKACDAIDVFVRYLGSELQPWFDGKGKGKAGEGQRLTFAQEVAATLFDVWPPPMATNAHADLEAGSTATAPLESTEDSSTELQTSPTTSTLEPEQKSINAADKSSRPPAIVPTRIVCLGLGSPTASRSAQIQLALLVVLRSWLTKIHSSHGSTATGGEGIDSTPTKDALVEKKAIESVAYDPIFTPLDRTILLKYNVITASAPQTSPPPSSDRTDSASSPPPIEHYYTSPTHPTLLYMPHCDRPLYEHILSLSLSPPSSSIIILLSNILTNYTLTQTLTSATSPTLHHLIPRFNVVHLPNYLGGGGGEKMSALVGEATQEKVKVEVGKFGRLWDRNALRELGFHWL